MYETYWQLDSKPFENTTDPRFYFPGEPHQSALLKLRYAIENRRGAAVLCGGAGTGKTLVGRMLRESLDEQYAPIIHLVFPQMSTPELLSYMADQLDGVGPGGATSDVRQSIERIEHRLAENSRADRHALIIVDEAHLIEQPETFEALRLLLNFQPDDRPPMTLLLCGQTMLLPILERMPALEERVAVKSLLRPLAEAETAQYVAHRLKTAGADREIFGPDAPATLQQLTGGVARRINRLCDLALLIGFAEERQGISAGHLESVAHELVAVTPE
jgi:general secretion pathway protein A